MSTAPLPLGSSWDYLRREDEAPVRWSTKLWPIGPELPARPATLAGALAAGALAALTIRPDAVGSAVLVVGVAVLAVVFGARGARPSAAELGAAGSAVALLAVGTFRSAEWLVALSLLAAGALGTLALVGARTWTGVLLSPLAACAAVPRTARWVERTLGRLSLSGKSPERVLLVVPVTVALLALFGALFAAADPAYREMVERVLPSMRGDVLVRRWFVFVVVAIGTVVAAYLAHRPPVTDALAPRAGKPVRRWEWAVPLGLLDLLFGTFVLVQLAVLFGGREHVLATAGLSYAEYARQGFGQLLAVTVLTLAVVALAVRAAPRRTGAERALLRLLLGMLCLLALVVVASAVHRMSLYEQAFGFTRLRLLATAIELSLGGVFVLLGVAGLRLTGSWLPTAVVGLACGAVLGLAALDPDAYVAEHNIARYEQTGRIDLRYLSTLSADAVPALAALPADVRACALARLAPQLRGSSDPWYDRNRSRSAARALLADLPVGTCRKPVAAEPAPVAEPAAKRAPVRTQQQ